MIGHLVRSLLQASLVMLAVLFIAFSMFRYVGDPIAMLVGQETTTADREALREMLGLDRPAPLQFLDFLARLAQGNLGISLQQGRPVADILAERLPATIELAVLSALVATVFGIIFGIYTAIRRKGLTSNAVMALSLIGVSLPTFLIGIGLIFVFAVECRHWAPWLTQMTGWEGASGLCLPSFGRGDTVKIGWWTTGLLTESGLKSLVMPVITLAFFQLTLIMRLVRAEMLEVMRTDYIKFARARGISERRIHFSHALKNTLVPVVTIIGLQLGSVIAFAIVTETVFNWPGLGALFVQSVATVDVPVMAAYLMFVGLVFVVVNLIVDFFYFVFDPRLRAGSPASAR
jgi:peptide/nickel transport system permease protein